MEGDAGQSGIAGRPKGTNWGELYGASLLCGVGFTMSLFIGALAFPDHPAEVEAAKLGTLLGSVASAAAGLIVLSASAPSAATDEEREEAREIFAEDQEG